MRVAELTAFVVRLRLRRAVRHASHARTSTDNVVVRCVLADGTTGWGEGVPRDYVTGETADGAVQLLKRSDLRGQLEPCRDFARAVAVADQLRLASVPGDDRGIAGNAARCAVELAFLDAHGQRLGMSLAAAVRIAAPELYGPRVSVQYSGAITASTGLKLKLVAWAYRLFGFRQVKVKVGIAGQDDPARLRSLRRRLGPNVELRVDANEAWSADEAVDQIRALEPSGIESVEQPVPHADVDRLTDVRKQTPIPIMLDESLCGMFDAQRALAGGLCDRFNLRLSKCGGVLPTLRLAQFARAHGLSCQLGCQVGESAILSAAGRQFATNVGGLTAVEGSFDGHLLKNALGYDDLTFGRGGWAPALERPGLGVWVRQLSVLERAIAREELLG